MTTKLDRPIRRARAAKAMGITRQGLHVWIDRLITAPIRRAGLEPPESLSLQQIWSIGIARAARQSGEPLEACCTIHDFLSGLPPTEIDRAFAEERTCLFIINGSPVPRLVSVEATTSAEFKQLEIEAKRIGYVPRMLRLNVQPLLLQLADLAKD